MSTYFKGLEDISYEIIIGNALFFLLIGLFLYGNYVVGKAISDDNKITGFIHVIRIFVFAFIAAFLFPFSIYHQAGELAKFLPSLSLAGFSVGLTSAFFTRKSK